MFRLQTCLALFTHKMITHFTKIVFLWSSIVDKLSSSSSYCLHSHHLHFPSHSQLEQEQGQCSWQTGMVWTAYRYGQSLDGAFCMQSITNPSSDGDLARFLPAAWLSITNPSSDGDLARFLQAAWLSSLCLDERDELQQLAWYGAMSWFSSCMTNCSGVISRQENTSFGGLLTRFYWLTSLWGKSPYIERPTLDFAG